MSRKKRLTDRSVKNMKDLDDLAFWENGLLPVVTQSVDTGEVLMVAFANREALEKTLATGQMHYWSRSRGELWHKGATSGNFQDMLSLHGDCDSDTLLARVRARGPACHTGEQTCFGDLEEETGAQTGESGAWGERAGERSSGTAVQEIHPEYTLPELWSTLLERSERRPAGSYTVQLLDDENLRLKKLGEETAELLLALARGEKARAAQEGADLVYHLLTALLGAGVTFQDLLTELERRKG